MNITYGLDLSKSNIASFSELVLVVLEELMKIGREIVSGVLRQRDTQLLMERDVRRFRCKGLRTTSVKTRLGVIEFQRRVYVDARAEGGKRCVFLLDEDMNIDAVGVVEKELCQQAAALACMTSYRNAAEIFAKTCAVSVSAKGIWNIVQTLGEKEAERIERYAELAGQDVGSGSVAAPILYEENDGVWLKLQGKDRKK